MFRLNKINSILNMHVRLLKCLSEGNIIFFLHPPFEHKGREPLKERVKAREDVLVILLC
jgi:hypothetical protein